MKIINLRFWNTDDNIKNTYFTKVSKFIRPFLCFIPCGLKLDIIEIVLEKLSFLTERKLTENTPRPAVNVVLKIAAVCCDSRIKRINTLRDQIS
jgi:hypothetical protein